MTSPLGDSTTAHYTATATFAQLIAEAKKAEKALRDLERAEKDLSNTAESGAQRVAKAARDRASAISSSTSEIDKASSANDKYARSFDAINRKSADSRKSLTELEKVAKTFASTNDKLAASFDKVNRAQSDKTNFAANTKKSIDEASASIEKFENRLQALFATAGNQDIDLNVNTESALNEVAKLAAEIQLLTRGVNEVEIRVNSNSTMLEIRRIARTIKRELDSALDSDALGNSQTRLREVARDIAADAAAFRREQARLDRELLEDQLELEGRLASSNSSLNDFNDRSSDAGRNSGLAAAIADMLEDNRNSLKSITDSFDSSITEIADKFESIKDAVTTARDLSTAMGSVGNETASASEDLEEFNRKLDELEARERQLDAEESKFAANRVSDQEKIRRAKTQTDVDKLKGTALRDEGRNLGITGFSKMRADDLRAEIAERYARDTLFAAQRQQERQALLDKRAQLDADKALLQASLKEQADIRNASIKKALLDQRAAHAAEQEQLRQNNKLQLIEIQRLEKEKQDILKKAAAARALIDKSQEELLSDIDKASRGFDRETQRSQDTLAIKNIDADRRRIKESLRPIPDQNIIDSIIAKSANARSQLESDVAAIIDRLNILRRETDIAQQESDSTDQGLKGLLRRAPDAASLDDSIRQNPAEIEEFTRAFSELRKESEETGKTLSYYNKLEERELDSLQTVVNRVQKERTVAIQRAVREQERETERARKDLEKLNKLPASEQFKLWAKDAIQSIGLVLLNTEKGEKQLRRLDRESRKYLDSSGSFKVDPDSQAALGALARKYAEITKEINAGEHAAGRFRATGARIAEIFRNDVRGNFTVGLVKGLNQLGDASVDVLKKLTRVSGELYRMPGIILLLISSISGLIAGLGAAGAGFIGMANAAASALGVLAAAPGLIAAVGSAFGSVLVGSQGIGDVLSAARKSQDAAAASTKKGSDESVTAARQQRAAARGLRDAYENLTDAQDDQKKAQLDVAKAWREAKEDLIDLQFTVRQGVIDEERAIINLRKARLELARIQAGGSEDPKREKEALLKLQEARKEYNKILADGNSTAIERAKVLRRVSEAEIRYAEATRSKTKPGDRQEAQLDVKDAELALERIRNTNKRNQAELAKIQKEGLGSTDRVVNANDRLADATERVADAQEAIIEAQQRVKEVNEDAAKGTDKAKKASDELEAALDKLGPKTRIVVEAMLDLIPAYDAMQDRIGDRLFGPIADDTERFNDVLEISERVLGKAADAMGYLLEIGLKLFTSGPWKKDFGTIADSNYRIIKNLGLAVLGAASAFKDLIIAAKDFTEDFAAGLATSGKNFAEWASKVRSDGSLAQFLSNSQEDIDVLVKIFKDLVAITVSYFKATEKQGDYILGRLKLLTSSWRSVAKEQEKAGSGLQKFLVDSRPALSALVSLLGAVGKAFADIASDPENLKAAVGIFKVLEEDVLPPLVDFLNEFSQSNVAPKIASAVGDIIDAIAQFLDSGGGAALAGYFEVLAYGIGLITDFVTLPGVKDVFGALAQGIAIFAAAATIAKFAGLFKLWDFFKWVVNNKKSVTDGLRDASTAASGGNNNSASSGSSSTSGGAAAAAASSASASASSANSSATKLNSSASKLTGAAGKVKSAVAGFKTAASSLAAGLGSGGVAGLAVAGALVAFDYFAGKVKESEDRVDGLKDALIAASGEFKITGDAGSDAIRNIIKDNPELADTVLLLDKLGKGNPGAAGVEDLLAGIGGDYEKYREVVDTLNEEINGYKDKHANIFGLLDADEAKEFARLKELRRGLIAAYTEAEKKRDLDEKIAGATSNAASAQQGFNFQSKEAKEYMKNATESSDLYRESVKTLNDPLATAEERLKAMNTISEILYGTQKTLIEQDDDFASKLLDLKEATEQGGKSLSNNTREGQRNREMLKTAAEAAKNFYEQDIAAKVPQKEANERYQERIEKLKKLATELGLNKDATKDLIEAYGGIDTNIETKIRMTGDAEIREKLIDLLAIQTTLKNPNVSIGAAKEAVRKDVALADRVANKNGYVYTEADKKRLGLAYGGFVSGPGGPRDDMIQAWLSNREFVQPADATEYYGVPFMEKIRRKQIPKQEAQRFDGNMFSDGGHVTATCKACESGHGHAKFANGGMVTWPFTVDASKTKVDPAWVEDLQAAGAGYDGPLGDKAGSIGYRWQMSELRKVFPGLQLISGFRPGSRTSNGSLSWHARNGGRAVDIPPRQDVFNWIVANYGKRTKELIWGGDPTRNIYEGRNYRFSDTLLSQHGPYNGRPGPSPHIHWAFKDGGLVNSVMDDLMKFTGIQAARPSLNMPSPRSLSQAAHSVINNTQDDNSRETNYNITVNNPAPERGGDSIRNSLARTVYMYDN